MTDAVSLNTLYVTTQHAYVARERETLKVKVDRETRLQVPLHHLTSVVCFGVVKVSPEAMGACAEAGILLAFLDVSGRFLARVEGPLGGGAVLRRAQYRAADEPAHALSIARACVAGKLANSRALLLRAARSRPDGEGALDAPAERLKHLCELALRATSLDELRGLEGDGAARYFGVFDAMLGSADFRFERRTRRPPENEVNAMLSFGYALLAADCAAALNAAGLDPAVGYLHADRPRRPALALDLMEELRSLFVDRLVLAMVRLGQVKPGGFERLPTGEVRMTDETRKAFLVEYQARKRDPVTHPLFEHAGTWAEMPHIQARLLARAIRGEGDYVPFLVK